MSDRALSFSGLPEDINGKVALGARPAVCVKVGRHEGGYLIASMSTENCWGPDVDQGSKARGEVQSKVIPIV
jgi:hypothetical protein